jgi:hypothetical protein
VSVCRAEQADHSTWRKKNCTKRLAATFKLVTEAIPADPGAPAFRQGDMLGDHRKHWFRANFFQRYRLFHRFNSDAKIIVLAWAKRKSRITRARTFRLQIETLPRNGGAGGTF